MKTNKKVFIALSFFSLSQFAFTAYAQQVPSPKAGPSRVAISKGRRATALSTTKATSGGGLAGSGNDPLVETDSACDHCSDQAVPAGLTFDDLKSLYESSRGTPLSFDDLTRNAWMAVAGGPDPQAQLGPFANYLPNGENQFGHFGQTQGPYSRLTFSEHTSDWKAGPQKTSEFFVGGVSLSRYKVTDDGINVCFPMRFSWAFTYSLSCHFVDANKDRLICAVTLTDPSTIPSAKPWVGQVTNYLGFAPLRAE